MKNFLLLVVTLLCFTVLTHELRAQSQSPKISVQGVLKDDNAVDASDGTYDITFRLYNTAVDGSPIWEETAPVEIKGGVYSHLLGSETVLTGSVFNNIVYLGVVIGGIELAPRTKMTHAPYALSVASTQRIESGGCSGAVGDVKYSILAPDDFAQENGDCWVPMNGAGIDGSLLASMYNITTTPDMSGSFLRAQEYNDGNDPDRTPASAVALAQNDANKPHAHTMSTAGAHNHDYDDAYFRNFRTNTNSSSNTDVTVNRNGGFSSWLYYPNDFLYPSRARLENKLFSATTESAGEHTHSINASGEIESRPKNMNFYIYMRVN